MVAPRTNTESPAEGRDPARTRRGGIRALSRRTSAAATPSIETLTARLLAATREHYPHADLSGIERAVAMAVEAHGGQLRASGEPYVTHPIAAAELLAELGLDPVAIEAAVLHDVPEDTGYSIADIEEIGRAHV